MGLAGGQSYLRRDSTGLSAAQSFELYRDTMGPYFDVGLSDSHGPVPDGEGHRALVEVWEKPGFSLTRTFATRTVHTRTRRLVLRSGFDHYFVACRLAVAPRPGERLSPHLLRPGFVIINDLGYATGTFYADHTVTSLFIERDRLDPLLTRPVPPQGLVLPVGSAAAGLICARLAAMIADPDADFSDAAEHIAGAIVRGLPPDAVARRFPVSMMTRIRSFIEANLQEPDLSVGLIIHRFGVSRTVLYELFEPLGGVATYIRARRLERCLARLGDPAVRHLSISDIAFSFGFNADAHFSRWFRRYHGIAASEVRRGIRRP